MARDYKPRRCSKRWLDGDCPPEVLAIIDAGPNDIDRYDVFFTSVYDGWIGFMSLTESGDYCHGELPSHEVSAYRYRMAKRYCRWTDLPLAVKSAVLNDIRQTRIELSRAENPTVVFHDCEV